MQIGIGADFACSPIAQRDVSSSTHVSEFNISEQPRRAGGLYGRHGERMASVAGEPYVLCVLPRRPTQDLCHKCKETCQKMCQSTSFFRAGLWAATEGQKGVVMMVTGNVVTDAWPTRRVGGVGGPFGAHWGIGAIGHIPGHISRCLSFLLPRSKTEDQKAKQERAFSPF